MAKLSILIDFEVRGFGACGLNNENCRNSKSLAGYDFFLCRSKFCMKLNLQKLKPGTVHVLQRGDKNSCFLQVLNDIRFRDISKIKTIGSTYMVACGLDEQKRSSTTPNTDKNDNVSIVSITANEGMMGEESSTV